MSKANLQCGTNGSRRQANRGWQPANESEKKAFINRNPGAEKMIRPFSMGEDFIKGKPGIVYGLWMLIETSGANI